MPSPSSRRLQHAFADWLKEIEGKAEALLADSDKDAAAGAAALKIREESVTYILARLAARGRSPSRGRHESELANRRGSSAKSRHR